MTKFYVLAILACILVGSQVNGILSEFRHGSLGAGKPNPLNPNFNYVEVIKVNKTALNIPYPGEFYTGYIPFNTRSEVPHKQPSFKDFKIRNPEVIQE